MIKALFFVPERHVDLVVSRKCVYRGSSWPTVASASWSIRGSRWLSFEHALFRLIKIYIHHFPLAFFDDIGQPVRIVYLLDEFGISQLIHLDDGFLLLQDEASLFLLHCPMDKIHIQVMHNYFRLNTGHVHRGSSKDISIFL